jgi:divalent metal cation (Fe/Co/Zn/Cd) transporter
MDVHPAEIVDESRGLALAVPGVAAVEKVRARKLGLRYLIDMHIEVDGRMTVRDSHALAHHVRDHICAAMPQVQDVLVHVEPHPPLHRQRISHS